VTTTEEPLFISPWNNNPKESIFASNLQKHTVHPFARRTKHQYIEPPSSSPDGQGAAGEDDQDKNDSFDAILKIANK